MPPRSNKKIGIGMMLIAIIILLIILLVVLYNKTRINVYAGIDARASTADTSTSMAGTSTSTADTSTSMAGASLGEYSGRGEDVFLDIYKAPLRNDNCINIPTQSCGDAPYRQVGILTTQGTSGAGQGTSGAGQGTSGAGQGTRGAGQGTSSSPDSTILPLMGRPLFKRRDKWNFYTLNDKNNMIKLPVKVNGRSGTDEIGCDNVYTGDLVFVEGYQEKFKFTAYDNEVMRYLPTTF